MTLSTTEITNTVTVTENPDSITIVADNFTQTGGGGGGSGTVTSVSVTTANGVSGTVATATTTPAITMTLGAITPTTVNGLTLTTSTGTVTITNLKTFAVTNTITLSGTDGSTLNIGAGGTLGTAAFTASTAYLAAASNLSDLASASTARTNLGLGTLATQSGTFSGTSSGTNTGDQNSIVGITGTFAQFNTAVTDADLARTSGTNTFTGTQTAQSFVGTDTVEGGTNSIAGTLVIWQGDTLGNYLALSTGSYLTTPRDWIFPDSSDTFVGLISTQTLTNKTISGSSNTLTNIALSSLAQSSATTGQVPTWNGSAWAAATPSGGSGDTYLVLASDTANSTTSFADVTGLTFAVTSGETYVFAAWVVYETAATTTGSKWAVNGPASPTILSYSVETPTAATTSRLDFASTYDGTTASSQTAGIGQCLAKIEGVVKVSASGTFALRFGSEVGSSAVTAKAGSFMRYRKIAP